ncbi:Hypothetical_protein [Hexamita inflata]|uniref:Hypothetical_protein n=1 Tax=Hexamita inflata TaxID=28002 RepID=A0AA86QCN1_9EUKA|nr:Hypothetical protein HINF_LOCUS44464 [Hexamita inflata]
MTFNVFDAILSAYKFLTVMFLCCYQELQLINIDLVSLQVHRTVKIQQYFSGCTYIFMIFSSSQSNIFSIFSCYQLIVQRVLCMETMLFHKLLVFTDTLIQCGFRSEVDQPSGLCLQDVSKSLSEPTYKQNITSAGLAFSGGFHSERFCLEFPQAICADEI